MARPANEWPIPVYVAEMRERVVVAFRVPAASLESRVPLPVVPDLRGGQAVVGLCLGNVRCFKPSGAERTLARELVLGELVTPVRWQGACRPAVTGLCLLDLFTDSPGLARLVRTAAGYAPRLVRRAGGAESKDSYGWNLEGPAGTAGLRVRLPRPVGEPAWQVGAFPTFQSAETALVHPEACFIPGSGGDVVRAVPVHQYARLTQAAIGEVEAAGFVAEALGVPEEAVRLDHVLFQKRCTHTWSFPPERIPVAARARPWLAPRERLPLAA